MPIRVLLPAAKITQDERSILFTRAQNTGTLKPSSFSDPYVQIRTNALVHMLLKLKVACIRVVFVFVFVFCLEIECVACTIDRRTRESMDS